MLALACCGALPATHLRADTAYTEDFAGGVSEIWSGANLPVSQATGTNTSWYLGELGNDTVTLALDGLDLEGGDATPNAQGRHVFVTVSYDLFVIGGWTGNNDSTPATAHTFAFETSTPQTRATAHHHLQQPARQFQTFPYDSGNGGYYAQPGARVRISSIPWASAARPRATTTRCTGWRAAATNRSPSTTTRMT